MFDEHRRASIQCHLIDWYRLSHRDLPWRSTRDPYRILVSEVMLQQTQAERVVPKYEAFLGRFPTIRALADAPASEVIRAWAGLGYNRRALNLHRACREVVERFDGVMPSSVDELVTLPGIGPYTAGAIACFAYGADVAFIDTNIRRVLQRVVHGPEHPPGTPVTAARMQATALDLLPAGHGFEWNQALMELGATLCRARNVDCERCPLQSDCAATPEIVAILRTLPRQRLPAAERFEQSSRYVRGRIIDALRAASDSGLRLSEIGMAVKPDFSDADLPWLHTHLTGLVTDGLVVVLDGSRRTNEESPPYDGDSSRQIEINRSYALPS